ncbi:GntR family transcriptional regulator [Saccharomonospora piscinae]|uniref:GntR family transcriptional regulator n=1 Tax=Saccharomonospora piscinae TaxID=687388 RepID=A0A1V9A4A1_SACPI|nr:winged helix-turn-helix domain-containing protein [Saccharomonospora piscinae]OQO91975.1 GntR family transcriptional regulator [Saccharomonospora piscinae]
MSTEELGLARYERVAGAIRRAVRTGELKPGEQLPASRELAKQHGVALNTAQRAVNVLRDEGWLVVRPTVGAFVSGSIPEPEENLRQAVSDLQKTVAKLEDRLSEVEASIRSTPPAE